MLTFILTLFPLLIFLPELIKSGGIIFKLTHVQPTLISLFFILVLFVLRLFLQKPLISRDYQKFYLETTLALILLTTGCLILLFFTYPNFIYAHTYIRIEILGYMVGAALTVWFIEKDNTFFSKNIKNILLFFPFGFFIAIMFLFLLPNNLLFELSFEDNLIENLQVIVLLIGCLAGITSGIKLLAKETRYGLLFILLGLGLFLLAGEEISWGQRIFHFNNIALENINVQKETNVHNIRGIHAYIPIVYIVIGFLGSFGALFVNLFQLFSKKFRHYLIPKNYFFFYFFFPFLYNTLTLKYGDLTEATELLLYLAVSLVLLQNQFVKKN